MKTVKKKAHKSRDDSLFGLLSSYKAQNTYFRVLLSDEDVIVQLTDNPKHWLENDDFNSGVYHNVRRIKLGVDKMSVKYITPGNIIKIFGTGLGLNIPEGKYKLIETLDPKGSYVFKTSLKYKLQVFEGVKKIITLTPQKRYEMLEKCIAENQE